jgi:hypothetical protein
MKLCAPAVVYLLISVVALVFNLQYSFLSVLVHIAFIGIWTLILNWICSKKLVWVSWLLVIIPYLFSALVILIAIEFLVLNDMLKNQPEMMNDNFKPYNN